MADLKCNHLKDETVHVRGKAYQVDGNGVAKGVSEEHAKIMCQGSWKRISGSATPSSKPAPQKPAAKVVSDPGPKPKPATSNAPAASRASAKTAEEPKKKPKKRSSSGRKPKRNDA